CSSDLKTIQPLPAAVQQSRLRPRISTPGRRRTALRSRTPVAQTRPYPRPGRLHRRPSLSRHCSHHPWQLPTRRPTVHANGTRHENQRTEHHHLRCGGSGTINTGHRHLNQATLRKSPHKINSHRLEYLTVTPRLGRLRTWLDKPWAIFE